MKERPIIFSSDMVRAYLDGRKTVTRRVITSRNSESGAYDWKYLDWNGKEWVEPNLGYLHVPCRPPTMENDGVWDRVYPRWEKGDLLWVRETFYNLGDKPTKCTMPVIFYREKIQREIEVADPEDVEQLKKIKWQPSIRMPRWASRITLEIVSVRAERLQKITTRDALAEGVPYDENESPHACHVRFRKLWNSLNAKRGYGWDVNPWIWRIEFKKVKSCTTTKP